MLSVKGRHFPKVIILMAARWQVGYAVSYRDIEELMSEREEGDAGTAISWIAPFHRNDGINDFSGWTLWISLLTATR